ncbi:MAG: aminomethyltransferase family protein [Nocardioides sp.]
MYLTSPFYPRLVEHNTTGLWSRWGSYLSAPRYDSSAKHEYFAVRNSVGYFDSSPLFKYWIRGSDAERFLSGVLARDIRSCPVGKAQYTFWCDDRGFVLEDGVVFRHSRDEFFLTAAEPNAGYFCGLTGSLDVEVADVTDGFGVLAVQGPRARAALAELTKDIGRLSFFEHRETKIAKTPVTVSRTGYTGDLGYEILVPAEAGVAVLDAVMAAGAPHGGRLFGEQALLMTRIEAGLILIGSEFGSSRFAATDHDRSSPVELGFGWMFKNLGRATADGGDDRPFIGRDAIRRELAEGSSRWKLVGIATDERHWDKLHRKAGLITPKDETPLDYESMLYDGKGKRAGYATTLMYSPMLQRHIALAKVGPELAVPGTRVDLEVTINHEYHTVRTEVTGLPHFNPERKTA